jgi:hypothetical protein
VLLPFAQKIPKEVGATTRQSGSSRSQKSRCPAVNQGSGELGPRKCKGPGIVEETCPALTDFDVS